MRSSAAVCAVVGWLLAGCNSRGALYVELRTDLVPGEEIVSVRTLVFAADGDTPIETQNAMLTRTSAVRDGIRIAELPSLAAGSYRVRVEVGAPGGSSVAHLTRAVEHNGPRTMTFLITRDCRSVTCPREGDDPSHTECSGGHCVDPICSDAIDSVGESCTPECTVHADCTASAPCAEPQCTDGVCTKWGDDAVCTDQEYCDPDRGCRPRVDGGVSDAGVSDAGVSDAGPPITSSFCPGAAVRREVMAVFIVRFTHGTTFVPPPAIGMFTDVPLTSPYAPWIEQFARDGFTSGCTADTFCPTAEVTREQAAVFLVLAMHGTTYTPPAAMLNVFDDVMTPTPYARFIEQLQRDGITNGCAANLYCPLEPLIRAQAAIFIVTMQHGTGYVPPPATGLFDDVVLTNVEAPYVEQFALDGFSVGCGAL